MTWTPAQQIHYLMRLPWSVSVERVTDDGDPYWVARVGEIPSALATGSDEAELEREFWASLEASLRVYVEEGDEIPIPKGVFLPWKRPALDMTQPEYRFTLTEHEPRITQSPITTGLTHSRLQYA